MRSWTWPRRHPTDGPRRSRPPRTRSGRRNGPAGPGPAPTPLPRAAPATPRSPSPGSPAHPNRTRVRSMMQVINGTSMKNFSMVPTVNDPWLPSPYGSSRQPRRLRRFDWTVPSDWRLRRPRPARGGLIGGGQQGCPGGISWWRSWWHLPVASRWLSRWISWWHLLVTSLLGRHRWRSRWRSRAGRRTGVAISGHGCRRGENPWVVVRRSPGGGPRWQVPPVAVPGGGPPGGGPPVAVPVAVPRWRSPGGGPGAVPRWRSPGGGPPGAGPPGWRSPVAVPRWRSLGGGPPVAVPRWRSPGGGPPVAVGRLSRFRSPSLRSGSPRSGSRRRRRP